MLIQFEIFIYTIAVIDGSHAVYRISLSFRGPQMNRCRLIDEVSVYSAKRVLHGNFILLKNELGTFGLV